jgi:putative ABC transport system substrate-binding protein
MLVALGAAGLSASRLVFGQARSGIAHLGILDPSAAPTETKWRTILTARLRELGYVPGKNLVIEERYADGRYERLPGLAIELVRNNVDVILAVATPAIAAAQKATITIPIVMVRTADPIGAGFIASLGRPGGNITGLTNINVDVSSKYLELLRAAVPKLSRVGVLANPGTQTHGAYVKRIVAAAQSTNVEILSLEARTDVQIESAFSALKQQRADALIVLPDPFFYAHAGRIADVAIQNRLPSMSGTREPVEAGGLMSYGQDQGEHYYRAAAFIDKILKGAKPADLPVEQPTKLELVINQKTARALGLIMPAPLLLQADAIIE